MSDWYNERLNNPKWKCKRKKILERDNNQCTVCKSKSELAVHHTFYYDKFIDPWMYPNESLLTLCDKCHKEYHEHFEVEIKPYKKPEKNQHKLKPKKKRSTINRKRKQKKQRYMRRESIASLQAERGMRVKKKNGDIIYLTNASKSLTNDLH